ncbi:MAG: efflux transporter outer membrane subunit [Pseudomonadota bacterium]
MRVSNQKFRQTLSLAAICAALAACTPHSIETAPTPNLDLTQDQYAALPYNGTVESEPWYHYFKDPELNTLIEQSFGQNFEIQAALARLDAAAALARESAADYKPAIDGLARSEESIIDGDRQDNNSAFGLNLDWEVDAFGRLRALNEADRLEAKAAAEDVKAARLALSATLAETYYAALSQHLQLNLLAEQSELDNEFLNLLDLRFQEGVGNRIDVLQQQSQVAETQSLIPPVEANYREFENRLDVLLGGAPDGTDHINDQNSFPDLEDLPPLGVPSDLLLNRPDLRTLQKRLVAQDAEIAAAIADRLPRITLTGSLLYTSGGSVDGVTGSLLGALVQPLLDWGQRKSAVERNKALYREQLAEFTQAYLDAVEDVENTLYRENRQREYIRRLQNRADILQENVEQAEAVFTQGISDYLPVLTALQSLRLVERSLIAEKFALIENRINLYRAVGGYIPTETSKQELDL